MFLDLRTYLDMKCVKTIRTNNEGVEHEILFKDYALALSIAVFS